MPKGFGVELGWCGFGQHEGPPRIFCLGFILIAVFPNGIEAAFASYVVALKVKRAGVSK
ncbi:hypothetical protein AA103196_3120 [Ameyamaea chiangmaiensis NBRC 103196]|nr:hypothetical protein AA103196_3120 [Ameyamaea chiangmaiensis NBRC 103196]